MTDTTEPVSEEPAPHLVRPWYANQLYLWQVPHNAPGETTSIGHLSREPGGYYVFWYTEGMRKLLDKKLAPLLVGFPVLNREYSRRIDSGLFPFFANRIMNTRRPDYSEYLKKWRLPQHVDPMWELAVTGGIRVTDQYFLCQYPRNNTDGELVCRYE